MNRKEKMLVGCLVIVLVAIFGCASIQNTVIPCYINPGVGVYAGEDMTSWMPWTTIWDADRLAAKMKFLHEANLVELERAAEDDTKYYGFLNTALVLNRKDAVEFRSAIFSPTGPVGLLLPALSGLGLGAFLIKRPKEKELEKELNGLKNNS